MYGSPSRALFLTAVPWPRSGVRSVVSGRANGKAFFGVLALLLLCLGGCTDLQVSARVTDARVPLPAGGSFRFARAALDPGPGMSAGSLAGDAGARAAIAASLAARGFRAVEPGAAADLVVDYTLRDGIVTNAPGLDGPSDYRRSWRAGSFGDGTGAMDHTVASSDFRRQLVLTVLLRPETSSVMTWEGRASQSVAPDFPDAGLGTLLGRLCRHLFEELP
jgi:hypothetical protein